jgi:hypothetical protein
LPKKMRWLSHSVDRAQAQQSAGLRHITMPEAGNTGCWLEPKKPHGDADYALAHTVFAAELIDPATGVDNFLLARVKRMTSRANFDREILTEGASRSEFVAATTGYFGIAVIGMDFGFHCRSSLLGKRVKKGA